MYPRPGVAFVSTCDWGDCDDPTVGFRLDDDVRDPNWTGHGWLSVCQRHYDAAPPEKRALLSEVE